MNAPCGGDPLVCIEFVVLAIGAFLQDWTTIVMLALLLGLLLKLRVDRRQARDAAYARQLAAYEHRRNEEKQREEKPGQIWPADDDQTGES